MRRQAYYPIAALAAVIAALVMGGCVVIQSQSASQLNVIGAVQITTTACFSGQPGCSDNGNSGNTASPNGEILLGYRIPVAAQAPQMISSTGGEPVTFSQDGSYTAELQRLDPAPPGLKWVGYRTENIASVSQSNFTVSPSFGLSQQPNGVPFTGPFIYQVVTGSRQTPSNPDDPVDCGSSLTTLNGSNNTICVDSPNASQVDYNSAQPTLDLGVYKNPKPHRTRRGRTAHVQFTLVYAGGTFPPPTFSLSATSDVVAGSLRVSPGRFTPAPGERAPFDVTVPIPRHARLGMHQVTITATLPNGQTRTGTRQLLVRGALRPHRRHSNHRQGSGCRGVEQEDRALVAAFSPLLLRSVSCTRTP